MLIMVVDDEPDTQVLFRQRFRKEIAQEKIHFVFALSAEEALGILRAGDTADIVLILSDINMPGMNGLQLLRHLKEHWPEIEVVMITAYGDEAKHRDAMASGADGYVTKPIDFDELRELILEKLS